MTLTKPYWFLNKQASYPALKQDMRSDVAVIGAGMTGSSVCYWLSSKCSVMLLEEDTVASKASGRNAGFLLTGTSDYYKKAIERYGHQKARTIWDITQKNHDLLERHLFTEEVCDHRRSGSYLVASSDKEMQELLWSVNLLRKDGFNYKLISEREIKHILSCEGFHGAAFNARDGEVNPVKLVQALIRKARDKGTKVFENTPVKHIAAEKDGFSIRTPHNIVKSKFVVFATNAYTPLLHPYMKGKIVPLRGQMLATNPVSKRFEGVFYANYGYEYWRQAPDGRVLAGGFRELDFAGETGYRMVTTRKIQKSLEELLRRLSLKFKVEYRWSGIMDFTEDRLPIIGSLPAEGNLLVAAGYSGHGLGFGFLAGRMISEIILNGKTKYLELFSASRFSNPYI